METINEYNGGEGDKDSNIEDKGRRKKIKVGPTIRPEMEQIDKILTLGNVTTEVPGRALNHSLLWSILPLVTSSLKRKKKNQVCQIKEREVREITELQDNLTAMRTNL